MLMAQPWCTGPAHIFLGIGLSGSLAYLGTAERTVHYEIRHHYEPIFNDIGGVRIPIDVSDQGEEGFVSADITRWNMDTYNVLAATPRPFVGGATAGFYAGGDQGTQLITEGFMYQLAIQFPYGAGFKPAYAPLEAGRRFYQTYLLGPEVLEPLGTQPHKRRLTWHALRFLAASTNNTISALCYDGAVGVVFPPIN
jgi:hypothetical protein